MGKKYVVPEQMVMAAYQWCSASFKMSEVKRMLEAATEWLAANPIVPDDTQIGEMMSAKRQFIDHFGESDWIRWGATDWQRRMFLAPEPEVPEAVKDLMISMGSLQTRPPQTTEAAIEELNKRTLEAYRRGQSNSANSGLAATPQSKRPIVEDLLNGYFGDGHTADSANLARSIERIYREGKNG